MAEAWLLVLDERAQPLPSGRFPVPPPGGVLVPAAALPPGRAAHTLRELEEISAAGQPAPRTGEARWPAVAFHAADFPPCPGETVAAFADRLLAGGSPLQSDPMFRVLPVGDPSEIERPELTARVPADRRRLLDVGCGSGGTAAALARRIPGLSTTGIEKDPDAAARAEKVLDRVIRADAEEALGLLQGELFDVFLFADVLEHLEDPVAVLKRAGAIASPGALLLASVPNAGHLSLVRDLAAGRFDPVPAGLADVGHLRWFTKASLAGVLQESGWRVVSVEGEKGAAPPGAGEFESRLSAWPGLDRESLEAYQWIAVAAADPDSLLGSLETPPFHRLALGEANLFRGVALGTEGEAVRSVRVTIGGGPPADYPCDRPSPDLAEHLPHVPAAPRCRFELEALVPRDAGRISFEAVFAGGRAEGLFDYDLAALHGGGGDLERMRGALDSIPTPDPEIVFLTQGHRDAAGYQNSILPAALHMKRYLSESGVDPSAIASVLDFGCGSGRILAAWRLDGTARSLTGCDANRTLIEWARDHLPGEIRFDLRENSPPLPYPDGSFDLICAVSVFTHLRRRSQELWARELARVVKPGGALLLTVHGRPYVRLFHRGRLAEFDAKGRLELEAAADGANESASFHAERAVDELFAPLERIGTFPSGRIGGRRVLFPLASIQDVYVARRVENPSR